MIKHKKFEIYYQMKKSLLENETTERALIQQSADSDEKTETPILNQYM